jgi:lactate racemase
MTTITLPIDKNTIDFHLPQTARVRTLSPSPMCPLSDPEADFIENLESPVESEPLEALAKKAKGDVLILLPDHTRVSGKERTLPWLLDELNSYGVPDERIIGLIALGSHNIPKDEVAKKSVGPAYDRIRIIHHDIFGPMTDYGKTSRETPLRLNAILKSADLVILLSSVAHHYFAGYGGGRKIILPGISSLETIQANHSLVWDPHGDGRNQMVKTGNLDGNPVHEDMLEAAKIALRYKPNFTIITALTPDKEFALFASGDIDLSHRVACEFIDQHNMVEIEKRSDLVFASAGGYPKDLNVVQSHKAFDNAAHALKPGGTMVFAMGCADGSGSPVINEFAQLSLSAIKSRLTEKYEVFGQTVYAAKEKTDKFKVICLTNLDVDLVKMLGFIPAKDADEVFYLLGDKVNTQDIIYHIPRADLTIPVL